MASNTKKILEINGQLHPFLHISFANDVKIEIWSPYLKVSRMLGSLKPSAYVKTVHGTTYGKTNWTKSPIKEMTKQFAIASAAFRDMMHKRIRIKLSFMHGFIF